MTLTRGFIRNAATTPLDARLMDMAQIVCNADGSPRAGVLGNANASIVSTTGTMNLAVAAAEFVATKGKADGVSIFTNDGSVNVPVTAAPASNSRIDVLWVKHEDNTTGDAASAPIFGVTAGTAAASPVKPSIPTGALELATLRIFAGTVATNGGSNVLTNTYQMTASRGGVVPFRTTTELNAWTTAPTGQLAYDLSTSKLVRWTGAAWSTAVEDTGWVAATLTGAWVNFGAPYVTAKYRRVNGVVFIEGTVKDGGLSATILTLPVGFRPSATKIFATPANAGIADVRVQTTGEVFVPGYYAGGTNGIVSLNVSFPADA